MSFDHKQTLYCKVVLSTLVHCTLCRLMEARNTNSSDFIPKESLLCPYPSLGSTVPQDVKKFNRFSAKPTFLLQWRNALYVCKKASRVR